MGNYLIVCLDTDRRIKEKKGQDRPFNKQEDRKEVLEAIKFIDEVILFDTDEELESICWTLIPNIRLVGSDYKGKDIIRAESFVIKSNILNVLNHFQQQEF